METYGVYVVPVIKLFFCRYAESDSYQTRLFNTNGLMRTRLTPDANKLIIATAGGYLMVVHDLDLNSLSNDLHGFKPNMYRLMQMSQKPIRQGKKKLLYS